MLSAIAAANALQPTVHTVEALIARHRPKQHFLKIKIKSEGVFIQDWREVHTGGQ